MRYLTGKELSVKWGIGQCRIIKLAREGRINGARKYGKTWVFPENAVKPADGRSKRKRGLPEDASGTAANEVFRYPIFCLYDISAYDPPLTGEEQRLHSAAQAFNSCRFDEACRLLGDLPETAVNRYCRIGALYLGCMLGIIVCNTQLFFDRYGQLFAELQKDFPYKEEMSYLLHELHSTLGSETYLKNGSMLQPDYKYHKSFLPHLTALCAVSLSFSDKQHITDAALASYELNSFHLENSCYYFDLQILHYYLGVTYAFISRPDKALTHFRRVFELAEKYELYYCPASEYYYMKDILEPALSEFSETLQSRMHSLSNELHGRYIQFTNAASVNTFYNLLSGKDYLYVFYAVQGYTNKEIAPILNKTPSAVGMHFSSIYTKLGIKGKKELIQFYEASTGNSVLDRQKVPFPNNADKCR